MDEETSRDSEVSAEKVESTVEISPAVPSVSSVPENWKEIDVKSENDDSKTVTASAEEVTQSVPEEKSGGNKYGINTAAIMSGVESGLNTVKSVFGNIVTKVKSSSIAGQVQQAVTTVNMDDVVVKEARAMMSSGALEGGGPSIDDRVNDLVWGWSAEAKVDKQTVAFYRLTVSDVIAESGFLIHCRSNTKGKFKIAIFGSDGNIIHQSESMRSYDKSITYSSAFFTKFDTYQFKEDAEAINIKDFPTLFGGVPALFRKLDNYEQVNSNRLSAGTYLICVYGNNLLPSKSDINILAVPCKNDQKEINKIVTEDQDMIQIRESLQALQAEYVVVKSAFEDCITRMNERERKLYTKLQSREEAYRSFILTSARAYSPTETVDSIQKNTTISTADEDILASIRDKSNNKRRASSQVGIIIAGTPLEVAASTASTASGWLATKVTAGVSQLQTIVRDAASNVGPYVKNITSGEKKSLTSGEGSDSTVPSDPAYEAALAEYNEISRVYEAKLKASSDHDNKAIEAKRNRAITFEADKARLIREAALSTERWLESFGLDKEERAKQEEYAKTFAEKLLKERMTAEEARKDNDDLAMAVEYQKQHEIYTAELAQLRTAMEEKAAKKDELEKNVMILRQMHEKLKQEQEATLIAEKLEKERIALEQDAVTEDEVLQRKVDEAKAWADRLEHERTMLQENVLKEQEMKLKQEKEAKALAERLANERISLAQQKPGNDV